MITIYQDLIDWFESELKKAKTKKEKERCRDSISFYTALRDIKLKEINQVKQNRSDRKKQLYQESAINAHYKQKDRSETLIKETLKAYYLNEYYKSGEKEISKTELSKRTGISREHLSRKYSELCQKSLYVGSDGTLFNCL